MILDFLSYELKVLSSLTPNNTVDLNLRAVMCGALYKLKRSYKARVAVHVFVNPDVREAHALVVGSHERTTNAVLAELARQSGPAVKNEPADDLPRYVRLDLPREWAIPEIYNPSSDESNPSAEETLVPLDGQQLWILNRLYLNKDKAQEFLPREPRQNDMVVVIPLRGDGYRRFGYCIIWAPDAEVRPAQEDPVKLESRVMLRKGISRVLIRLFTNFYRIGPDTYLPSYHREDYKPVTLFCAEIGSLDAVCDIVRGNESLSADNRRKGIRRLISGFLEITSGIVAQHRGRVDQMWGSGLLAVFGEYMDEDTEQAAWLREGCVRAVSAARACAEEFQTMATAWRKKFIPPTEARHSSLKPCIAIDHGDVIFDYVGSSANRTYMALGERVSLVKELALFAARDQHLQNNHSAGDLNATAHICQLAGAHDEPSILLTSPAYKLADTVVVDSPSGPRVHSHRIRLPYRGHQYDIWVAWPENLKVTTRPAVGRSG